MTERQPQDLRNAIRVARVEDAERSRAIADLRGAELARLDALREAIEPVLADVPADIEMFDAGLIPVPEPRLFIDMIAFVEMAHDRRQYRFIQETRQGRHLLAESESLDVMRAAVTGYVARRLVEREKALDDRPDRFSDRLDIRPGWRRSARASLVALASIVVDCLGVAALCVLLWLLGRTLYQAWVGTPHP